MGASPVVHTWDDPANSVLPALIDSATADCFINAVVAWILQIPLQHKATPDLIETIDGFPFFLCSSNRRNNSPGGCDSGTLKNVTIQHDPLPTFPPILCISWLTFISHSFDGKCRKSVFHRSFVNNPAPMSKIQGVQVGAAIQAEPSIEVASELFLKYQNYFAVFEKRKAETMSPPQDCDWPMELQPGAKIHFGRIYAMSEPKLTSLLRIPLGEPGPRVHPHVDLTGQRTSSLYQEERW